MKERDVGVLALDGAVLTSPLCCQFGLELLQCCCPLYPVNEESDIIYNTF